MDHDPKLISDAQAGIVEAFSQLVRLHQAHVRAYLSRYVRRADVVDDLAQEVFLSAYRSLGTYNLSSSFVTWLIGIARNRALDYLRKEACRQAHESGQLPAVLAGWRSEQLEKESTGPVEEQQRLALDECMAGLPKHSSQLLREYYCQNRSSGQIARELGRSESGVRMTLLRIRQALRECVEERTRNVINAVPAR